MEESKVLEGELIKASVGAPRKYNPRIADKFLEYRCQGKTQAQSMMLCDIRSWETLKRWQLDYPEFREAVAFGEVASQAYWENIGEKGILGEIEKFSASVYIFKMCNQFKEHYKQQNSGTNVQINNNLGNNSTLTTKELEQKALELSKKLIAQEIVTDASDINPT